MPARALAAAAPPGLTAAADDTAHAIARALRDGFDRHYALFRDCARAAKGHFESRNWRALRHVARDRIDYYDRRVVETVERIQREFRPAGLDGSGADALWERVKLHFIGLLIDHKQPECAETFFNSVSCKILHRTYFHNRFIFVRPAISTEHIQADPPTYRSYYPREQGLRSALIDAVLDFRFETRFADFRRDLIHLLAAFRAQAPRPYVAEANHQLQVLSTLFFRDQTAYAVGRVVNGMRMTPFAVAIRHAADGRLYVDALLTDEAELALLFSANRSYFLVDMEVPSAYVAFLHAMLPDKTPSELYTMVGLQKAGKNLFYRDFLHHLAHSRDRFIVAPGIRGLVMCVFTLPSYPYVFKIIKDRIAASKDTDAAKVQQKYALVKHHDRAGRMTDILEYSDVAFPRSRFAPELLAELRDVAPTQIEEDGDRVIVRHVYIERRMTPLNLFLEAADDSERIAAIRDYGDALRELAAVNIFAGDLLFKNFGMTRYGRVVFYDYDEIEYLTDCRFRKIPPQPPGFDEMSGDVWYPVGPHDVFPEEFATFLLTDPRVREAFVAFHADLLDAAWWSGVQEQIGGGEPAEVLSYPGRVRFAPPAPAAG
ncbi:MAG: bifunctional isocitrate dehydrogenase kinase/phosphatase [Betaproteobacteria bacterium]|nr:bifunctional isocitrate dehydrogenase kinase/phosphatase [Betaproteobacteria bacterium]